MEKEIIKGWELIMPEDTSDKITGLELAPMGVAEHLGINSLGEYIPKKRVTRELSFCGTYSKEAVNSRVERKY